jgi:hypothetical protein
MSLYPADKIVPSTLRTQEFVLVPLTAEHVRIDYEAVLSSREMLHLWSGSPWPWEGFTLADNLKDLNWHDREHQERVAFTYTVLDATESSCLGCVYIRPLADLATDNRDALQNMAADVAMIRFWVRASRLADGLDRRLLEALTGWFAEQWEFSRFLFHARQANSQQIELFEAAGLERILSLQVPQRGGTFDFYGVNK